MRSPLPALRLAPLLCAASAAAAVLTAPGCAPVTLSSFSASGDGGATGGDASGPGGGSSGGAISDSGLCAPGDVATYYPAYHPAAVLPGACAPTPGSPDLIGAFYEACFGSNKSDASCQQFRAAHPACAACILTPESAPSYGPIVDHGGFVTANVSGCIEIEAAYQGATGSGGSAVGCAKAVDALEGCELAACEANCPVSDPASLANYQACSSQASSGGCSTFAPAVACTQPGAEAGVSSACVQPDFGAFYHDVAPLFCLAVPALDGGSPSSDGGGAAPDGAGASEDSGTPAYDAGGGG